MTVKKLIEKLKKVDGDSEVMLHDGFSVNAIEIESVIHDKNTGIVFITPQEVHEDDLNENTEIL